MKRKKKPTGILARLKTAPSQAKSFLLTASFEKKYLVGSLVVLFGTTILWSLLSCGVQIHNSDELADPYLFKDSATLKSATFPGQHTFLLKWPLFWLVRLFNYSSWSFAVLTIVTVLVTVGGLVYLISRIEKRPVYRGTLFLALSSMLLLVPAEPYAGAILPLNMAMLATRNLEYILYIAAIYGLVKSASLRNWRFWAWSVLLILVAASDRLFLTLSLGGGILALIVYALVSNWELVGMAVRWLIASVITYIGAGSLLTVLTKAKISHIAGNFGAGPYGLIHSFHDFVLGSVYGVLNFFTNFGANPGYDANVLKRLPAQSFSRLFGWLGPAEIINLLLLIGGLYLAFQLLKASMARKPRSKTKPSDYSKLAVALIWSTLAALLAFVFTNHYWAVDGRYLTISLFAISIAAAVMLRQYKWPPRKLAKLGGLVVVGMLLALPGVFHSYSVQNAAQANVVSRNSDVAQVLKHRKVDVLVGDYWRVLPIKQASGAKLTVMPLNNCTLPRVGLTSSQWSYDLTKHSFAYLLTLRGNLTNFPNCTIDGTIQAYGRPNASVVISGSQANPDELLLFYDRGVRKSMPTLRSSTILPVPLDQLPYTSCPNGTTIMNVVAHQDDDLLFMNPDTQNALRDGHCVRTVYITAGDAGGDQFYWLSREQGSEAAYSTMLNVTDIWVKRAVQLGPNQFAQVSHPRNDYRASLIFLRLPDGNVTGSGFKRYLYESLSGLESGKVTSMQSVDAQSVYTLNQLALAIAALMRVYQPVEIHTQANYVSKQYPDHSDHMAVGKIVKTSLSNYELQQFENNAQIPLKYYIGYPIHGMPANVTGQDLINKKYAWYSYASYDSGACHDDRSCANSAYGFYLARQYQANN